ncbi:sulfotransferase family protein [Ekhidna sp.]|uniref:sulfotransferase family protein n=1 Tax=Ekhidna sp. TaxID=2608089 RepID=UPI003B5C5E44
MSRVNFFIVGVPKAGTTSLHDTLARHSQVYMSDPKEVNYFSAEDILNENLYYRAGVVSSLVDYEKIFQDRNETILGESSVSYFGYSSVPLKIREYNPEAKILIVLRNPVQRAFSHYLMDRKLGHCTETFEELANQYLNNKKDLKTRQYFSLSEYSESLSRYYELFEKNLFVCTYDDLLNNGKNVLDEIQKFLKIQEQDLSLASSNRFSEPRGFIGRFLYEKRRIRSIVKSILPASAQNFLRFIFLQTTRKPSIDQKIKVRLQDHYKHDLRKVEDLTGIDTNSLLR